MTTLATLEVPLKRRQVMPVVAHRLELTGRRSQDNGTGVGECYRQKKVRDSSACAKSSREDFHRERQENGLWAVLRTLG